MDTKEDISDTLQADKSINSSSHDEDDGDGDDDDDSILGSSPQVEVVVKTSSPNASDEDSVNGKVTPSSKSEINTDREENLSDISVSTSSSDDKNAYQNETELNKTNTTGNDPSIFASAPSSKDKTASATRTSQRNIAEILGVDNMYKHKHKIVQDPSISSSQGSSARKAKRRNSWNHFSSHAHPGHPANVPNGQQVSHHNWHPMYQRYQGIPGYGVPHGMYPAPGPPYAGGQSYQSYPRSSSGPPSNVPVHNSGHHHNEENFTDAQPYPPQLGMYQPYGISEMQIQAQAQHLPSSSTNSSSRRPTPNSSNSNSEGSYLGDWLRLRPRAVNSSFSRTYAARSSSYRQRGYPHLAANTGGMHPYNHQHYLSSYPPGVHPSQYPGPNYMSFNPDAIVLNRNEEHTSVPRPDGFPNMTGGVNPEEYAQFAYPSIPHENYNMHYHHDTVVEEEDGITSDVDLDEQAVKSNISTENSGNNNSNNMSSGHTSQFGKSTSGDEGISFDSSTKNAKKDQYKEEKELKSTNNSIPIDNNVLSMDNDGTKPPLEGKAESKFTKDSEDSNHEKMKSDKEISVPPGDTTTTPPLGMNPILGDTRHHLISKHPVLMTAPDGSQHYVYMNVTPSPPTSTSISAGTGTNSAGRNSLNETRTQGSENNSTDKTQNTMQKKVAIDAMAFMPQHTFGAPPGIASAGIDSVAIDSHVLESKGVRPNSDQTRDTLEKISLQRGMRRRGKNYYEHSRGRQTQTGPQACPASPDVNSCNEGTSPDVRYDLSGSKAPGVILGTVGSHGPPEFVGMRWGGHPDDFSGAARSSSIGEEMHRASADSKYESYACRVDRAQGDRSVEVPLFSFARPHMRAFHFAWMSFFVAFFTWFAVTPLLKEIQHSISISKEDIWNSNICGVAGTVAFRIMAGPICDSFGARWVMGATLFISAIPVMATGLINSAVELSLLRLATGIAGSAFVTCQYWTSTMFTREVAGTANSLAAGWGNLGGGVTQIVMGSALFPLFKWLYGETNKLREMEIEESKTADRAWRTVCIVPAVLSLITAIVIVVYSDDSPKGNYRKLKRLGLMPPVSAKKSLQVAARDYNSWILFVQYACCFGVELTMTNAAALFFYEKFGQSTESAAALASIFGWMNLFARGMGGFISDIMNVKSGMKGRLIWQAGTLILEGMTVIAFAYSGSLAGAICTMTIFSLFVQSSEGSTYSIVPYVNPNVTGSIAGLIGAGGNVGGVLFAVMFRQWDYRRAFVSMGWCVVSSSVLTVFISIQGHGGCWRRTETVKNNERIEGRDVPEFPDHFKASESNEHSFIEATPLPEAEEFQPS